MRMLLLTREDTPLLQFLRAIPASFAVLILCSSIVGAPAKKAADKSVAKESTADGPISVLNNGAVGNIALSWSAGSCPTGKTCGTPTSYNVYALYPTVPPAGLAGVSQ